MFVMFLNEKAISQILQYEILKKLVTFIIDVTHLGGRPFYDVTLNTLIFFQVICGTRMIPAPNMKDVIMDLQADSEQFLHGKAHKGMAFGAKNILVQNNRINILYLTLKNRTFFVRISNGK